MANLRPQNSQRTESLFAKNHEPFFNGIGPNAKCRHVMPACFSEQGGSRRRGGASVPQTNGEIQNGCQESRTEKSQAGRMAGSARKACQGKPLDIAHRRGAHFFNGAPDESREKNGHSHNPALWFRYLDRKRKGGERND